MNPDQHFSASRAGLGYIFLSKAGQSRMIEFANFHNSSAEQPRQLLRLPYHKDMARGWESKSVEEQQSSADTTTAPGTSKAIKEDGLERAKRERQKQELSLQRERMSPSGRQAPCAGLRWKRRWPISNPASLDSP